MYDVYLGGVMTCDWREELKSRISTDISIFDPYLENFDEKEKVEQIAREFYFIEQCDIITFYLDGSSDAKSVRVQIGEAAGQGKQVVICMTDDVNGFDYITKYCEYKGIPIVNSLSDLVTLVEECAAETDLCDL